MIQIDSLVKRYGSKLAVDNISLIVKKGEILGLLGPNGAGKSTTMKIIMGLLKPDRGEISVKGVSIKNNPTAIKKILGFVPQDLAIYENMSVYENVMFFGGLYGLSGKVLKEAALDALVSTGLNDSQKEKAKRISGGMKRRLNIACAIVHKPELIIMDEPTVGIDPQSRNHILESVLKFNKDGATVIYTSHYMEEVETVCSRVGIIDYGKLIALGSKEELKSSIKQDERIMIELGENKPNVVDELKGLSGIKKVISEGNQLEIMTGNAQLAVQDVLYVISKEGAGVKNISLVEPDLENVFLTLTGRKLRD